MIPRSIDVAPAACAAGECGIAIIQKALALGTAVPYPGRGHGVVRSRADAVARGHGVCVGAAQAARFHLGKAPRALSRQTLALCRDKPSRLAPLPQVHSAQTLAACAAPTGSFGQTLAACAAPTGSFGPNPRGLRRSYRSSARPRCPCRSGASRELLFTNSGGNAATVGAAQAASFYSITPAVTPLLGGEPRVQLTPRGLRRAHSKSTTCTCTGSGSPRSRSGSVGGGCRSR